MNHTIHQKLTTQYKNRIKSNLLMIAIFAGIIIFYIAAILRGFKNPLWQEITLILVTLLTAMVVRIIAYKLLPPHRHKIIFLLQLPLIFLILFLTGALTPMRGEHIPLVILSCIYVTEPLWTLCLLMADAGRVREQTYLSMNAQVTETRNARYKTLRNLTTGETIVFNKLELADNLTYRIYYYPHSKIMTYEQLTDPQDAFEEAPLESHPLDDIDEDAYRIDSAFTIDPQPDTPKAKKYLTIALFVGLDACALLLGFALSSAFWFALFPLIFGQAFGIAAMQEKAKRARCTHLTEGHVVDVVAHRSRYGTNYTPVVEYRVDGKIYRVEGNVSGPRDIMGELLTIRFNPNNPEEAMLNKKTTYTTLKVIVIVATLISVGMILFNLYDISQI